MVSFVKNFGFVKISNKLGEEAAIRATHNKALKRFVTLTGYDLLLRTAFTVESPDSPYLDYY